MPAYSPHTLDQVNYIAEMEVNSKGRLVKARLPEQPAPNVGWFWIPLGNCRACKYYRRSSPTHDMPECLNKKILQDDFFHKYIAENTCPEFEAGIKNPRIPDMLDVMKEIGLVSGKPTQKVEVIVNEPWSITLAERAHREEEIFLELARYADYLLTHPGANDPKRGEYVDLTDDLEGKKP